MESKIFRPSGVVKSVRIYLPTIFLYRGLSFIRGVVLIWLLAKQTGQLTLLTLALQSLNIIVPLAALGIHEAITRYVPAYQTRKKLNSFLGLGGGLIVGVALGATMVLLLFAVPLGHVIFAGENLTSSNVLPLTRVTFITGFTLIVYFLIAAILKGLRMFPALAAMELFHGVFYFILTILALKYIGPEATYVMWTYVIALMVPAIIWGLVLRNKLPEDEDSAIGLEFRPLAKQLIGYGIWSALGGIVWQTWQVYSLWHLTQFDTALHGDIFATSRQLGQLIFIFGAAAAGVVMTSVCSIWEKGARKQANTQFDLYAKLALLALLITAIALTAFRVPLTIIFPKRLSQFAQILPQTFLFFQFLSALAFISIQFVMIEKLHLIFLAWLTGLAANIALCFLWIKPDAALAGAANAAAWSCVPAILVALGLIALKKQPISPGMVVMILASFLLLLPAWCAGILVLILFVWSIIGNQIFDDEQRAMMIQRFFDRRIQ
ncbi:MAG: hypothetical protein WC975_05455 [Phycisphaerae bacterium]